MKKLNYPFDEKQIRALKVGDMVMISGKLFTGRDAVHKYLHEGGKSPVNLKNQIIYHCGPVVLEKGGKYEKWYALYEAADTFLYRPGSVTKTTAHVRDGIDLKRMMMGFRREPERLTEFLRVMRALERLNKSVIIGRAESFTASEYRRGRVDIWWGVGIANWDAYKATIREDIAHLPGYSVERRRLARVEARRQKLLDSVPPIKAAYISDEIL